MQKIVFLTIMSLFAEFLTLTRSVGVPPTWLTSSYIQSNSKSIITTLTGNSMTPTATLTFATAFSSIPNIGYGIAGYEGDDYLGEQMFEVNKTGLTTSTFSLLVQIVQTTNIWLMKIHYIAIDKAFPHKLNSFDNVPLNYSKGPLVNITVMTTATTYYTNTINFTAQSIASGQSFTQFLAPLSNNKVLLFMTSMFLDGLLSSNPPLNTRVTATVMTTQTYVLNFSSSTQVIYTKIHFSMIIFDQADVLSSEQYQLVYKKIDLPGTGGFIAIPQQFFSNLIIGLVEFQTSQTHTIINFNLGFLTNSTDQGLNFPLKAPRQTSVFAIRYGFTLFYMKTWLCPNYTYFNIFTDLCQNCSINYCLQCQTFNKCLTCNTSLNYFLNSTLLCQRCTPSNCLVCSNLTSCSVCDTNNRYFLNSTTNTCRLCSIPFCLTCLSLTNCSICNTATGYFLNSSTSVCDRCSLSYCITCISLTNCSICDTNNSYFLNETTSTCQLCSIPFCLTCSNLTHCSICDNQSGYFLNLSTLLCDLCNLSSCITCSSLTTCSVCDTNSSYFMNYSTLTCSLCSIPYCLTCLSLTNCSVCDTATGYFLNSSTSVCELCTLSSCLTCVSLTNCSICDTNNSFFLNQTTSTCQICSIPYCLTCLSLTNCSVCDTAVGYFLNSSTSVCELCSLSYCITCISLTNCSICDTNSNYFLNQTTSTCQLCSIPFCLTCSNLTSCQICDTATGYFLNSSTLACDFCTLSSCITCSSLTNCSICDINNSFFLNQTTSTCQICSIPFCLTCQSLTNCSICDNQSGYFFNMSTSVCDLCSLSYCLTCSSLTTCSVCDNNNSYFLNSSTLTCELCSLPYCLTCVDLTSCSVCDNNNNYFLNSSTSVCSPCTLPNCVSCSSFTSCSICQFNYYLNSSSLCEINLCRDGIYLIPEGCDDGNLVDGDGCSSTCTVQTNYTCEPNPNPTPNNLNSVCFYVGEITINVVYIEKIDNANQLEILLEIGPKDASFWKDVDFTKMVTLSNMTGFENYTVKMNSDGTVSLIANYNTTIQNTNITVQLDPAQSGKTELSRYPPVSKQFEMIPTDNELAVFYDGSVYQIANITNILAYVISCAALFLFIIGIFADKLVGVEMMAVVQISHLSLITLDNLNPVFKALANVWFVNGFNYFSMSKNYLLDSSTPIKVKGIYLFSYFFQNYNFTFLLIVVPLLLSLICLILSLKVFNLSKRKQIRKFSKRLACEYAFTGLMFSGYIVAVSAGLQIKYGFINVNELVPLLSIIKFSLIIFLIVLYFVLKIVKREYFGEFTKKFHFLMNIQMNQSTEITQEDEKCKGKIIRFHYNSLIIERIFVGTCLVFLMDLKFALLLPILVFVLFAIESIILKPYKELKHNIRFVCNMAITVTILIIYLCYNLANQKIFGSQSNVWIYMPLLVCVLLIVCILYSAVFLIKQFVRKIKEMNKMYKFSNEEENQWFEKQVKDLAFPSAPQREITLKTQQTLQNLNYRLKYKEISKSINKQNILKAKKLQQIVDIHPQYENI